MNGEMSTTKGVIWEENVLTEPKKKLENNGESGVCGIITGINEELEKKILNDTTKISGIYKIINKVNGKYYVGSSCDILTDSWSGRWFQHKYLLMKNKHHNIKLQRSWNKYGENNFQFLIIEKLPIESLLKVEQIYLDKAKLEMKNCYNVSFDAYCPTRGRKLSMKTRKRMSESKMGIGNSFYGKTHTSITRQLISKNTVLNTTRDKLHPNYNHNIYKFKNKISNEIFEGTKKEMIDYCKNRNIHQLFTQKRKSSSNWILLER